MPSRKTSWPADKVERRALAELVPCARNSRTHSEEQIQQIAASVREWGWTVPVLVDEAGGIIAGHGRVMAAKLLGLADVPVMVARGWTAAQKRAYTIADNKIPLNAGWDDGALRIEFAELESAGFDLGPLGFSAPELAGIRSVKGNGAFAGPDSSPEPPTVPVASRGDLWALGRHRILCGDATLDEDVRRLMDGAQADLILTDPPYCSGGFQESGRGSGSVGTDAPHKQIANDRLSSRGYQALLKTAFSLIGAPYLYAFTDWRMWVWLFDVAESSGYGVRSMVVWDKGTPGMGRGWRTQHELVLWAAKETPPFDKHMAGMGNVIPCARTGNVHHTTEKPTDLLRKLIDAVPFVQSVVDPFTGSGSTLIACEGLGRAFYGIELDPSYIDVAIIRWQNFTGEQATLNGHTFDEVRAERTAKAA